MEKRKRGRPVGWTKEIIKNERFFTYKVTPEEKQQLDFIFNEYVKKYKLKKIEALKKIFFTIAKLENINIEENDMK